MTCKVESFGFYSVTRLLFVSKYRYKTNLETYLDVEFLMRRYKVMCKGLFIYLKKKKKENKVDIHADDLLKKVYLELEPCCIFMKAY